MKILVVDDHALIRTALRGVLGQLDGGLTMLEASDCRSAFDLIEAQPDLGLVLLDLSLPGQHGLEALQDLRTRYPALPVVVVSSANDRASVMQASIWEPWILPKLSSNEVLVMHALVSRRNYYRRNFSPARKISPAGGDGCAPPRRAVRRRLSGDLRLIEAKRGS